MNQSEENTPINMPSNGTNDAPPQVEQSTTPLAKLESLSFASLANGFRPPEVAALKAGYHAGMQQEQINALISEYLRVSQAALETFSQGTATHWLALAKEAQADYFTRLQYLKAAGHAARPEEERSVLTALRETYANSGSPELAYSAAMECLRNGDFSHQSLFEASQAANQLGRADQLLGFLETQWSSPVLRTLEESSKVPLAFHMYSLARSMGATGQARQHANKIDSLDSSSPEALIVLASQQLEKRDFEDAVYTAMAAKDGALNSSGLLTSQAYSLALEALPSGQPDLNESSASLLRKKLLEVDRENHGVWDVELSRIIQAAGDDSRGRVLTDKLLEENPSCMGYLVAAEHLKGSTSWSSLSPEKKAVIYAYLGKAGEHEPLGVQSLLALSEFHLAENDTASSERALSQAAKKAPHHPALRRYIPAVSLHNGDGNTTETPTEKDGQSSIDPGSLSKRVKRIVINARKDGIQLSDALSTHEDDYAELKTISSNGSKIRQFLKESEIKLDDFIAATNGILSCSSISSNLFDRKIGGISYRLRQPPFASLKESWAQVPTMLRGLDSSLGGDKTIQVAAELDVLIQSVQSSHYRCNDALRNGPTSQSRANKLVKDLLLSLTELKLKMTDIVPVGLKTVKETIDRWTTALEAVDLPELGDVESSLGHP